MAINVWDSLIGSSCDTVVDLRTVSRCDVITSRVTYSSSSPSSVPGVSWTRGPKSVGGVTGEKPDKQFKTHSIRRKVNAEVDLENLTLYLR